MLPKYHSFLLRIWQAGPAENMVWRASLEDPHTHRLIGFDNLDALFEYLRKSESAACDQDSESNHLIREQSRK
jgi:hypothetical protein